MTGTIDRSVVKIQTYQALDTIKIAPSNQTAQEIPDEISCNRSSDLSSRACIRVISCGYDTGENRNQILSRVVFPLYSLGGILPQECFSGQKPMDLHYGMK